jgi:hypothetical protein
MKLTDAELYGMPSGELMAIENRMTAQQFFKWTVFKLNALVRESVNRHDWFEPKNWQLTKYRVKAVDFFSHKLTKRKVLKK